MTGTTLVMNQVTVRIIYGDSSCTTLGATMTRDTTSSFIGYCCTVVAIMTDLVVTRITDRTIVSQTIGYCHSVVVMMDATDGTCINICIRYIMTGQTGRILIRCISGCGKHCITIFTVGGRSYHRCAITTGN